VNKLIVFISCCLLLACQPQTDDLQGFIEEVANNDPLPLEPYPEFTKTPAFHYGATNLRSPFQRPKSQVIQTIANDQANCLQPDVGRNKGALEYYGLDALTITGFFSGRQLQWVLFQANDGSLHRAGIGDYVGLFFGKITNINQGMVYITEMLPDGAGCWQQKQNTLSMPDKSGEKNDV